MTHTTPTRREQVRAQDMAGVLRRNAPILDRELIQAIRKNRILVATTDANYAALTFAGALVLYHTGDAVDMLDRETLAEIAYRRLSPETADGILRGNISDEDAAVLSEWIPVLRGSE